MLPAANLQTAPHHFSRKALAVLGVVAQAALLIVLLALAIGVREVPGVPLADNDSWGYASPALSLLSGNGFRQTDGRDWLYPALVALFLKTSGSFAGIVAWQHVLGVLSTLVMAVAWRCWVSLMPFRRGLATLISLCGALPIFAQCVNPEIVYFEMQLRPEAVLPFFVYAQLACVLAYCRFRWRAPHYLLSVMFGAAALFLAYVCMLLKPSWLLASAVTGLPVFVGMVGKDFPWKSRIGAPVIGAAVALLLLWLPPRFWFIKDDASKVFLPLTLTTIHARLIEQRLEMRLANLPDTDPDKPRLAAFVRSFQEEFHKAESAPGNFQRLGYDSDYLFYHSSFVDAVQEYAGKDPERVRAFCLSIFLDAIVHEPGAFAQKVADQFSYFLHPDPVIFFKNHISLAKSYESAALVMGDIVPPPFRAEVQEMLIRYREELTRRAHESRELDVRSKWGDRAKDWAWLTLPLEIAFLCGLVGSILWAPLRPLALSGWGALILFLAPVGNALTVSIANSLDVGRYRFTYGGFLLFALAAMCVYLISILARSLVEAVNRLLAGHRVSPLVEDRA